MSVLRILLFLGMVLHKVLWEVWKPKNGAAQLTARPPVLSFKSLVKAGKALFLLFLIVQTLFLNWFPIAENALPLQVAGTAIYALGLGIAVLGRRQLGQNWSAIEDGRILGEQVLVTKGVYGYIRHPIYTGDTLLLIGLELALNSWLVLLMIGPSAVFARQAVAEEKMLSGTFPGYEAYRRQTKRFIPYVV